MRTLVTTCSALVLLPVLALAAAPPGAPPARPIPGVTAPDRFPNGCVDCHAPIPEKDVRISTLMKGWTEAVDPKLLARARAAAPGLALTGKHPPVLKGGESIPGSCLACHGRDSETAPPFAALLHAVHLEGGEQNVFLTVFQGECTHCHKLDRTTGRPRVPSAPEP